MHHLLHPVPLPDVQRCHCALQDPRVVVGENKTFQGAEDYMRSNGIQVDVLQDPECIQLMRDFIRTNPQLWNEDIGV